MRKLLSALCVLVCSATAARARPMTRGEKLIAAGIPLLDAGYGAANQYAAVRVTLQNVCIACEGYTPEPTDYRPLYGIIPVAGSWIELGRTSAAFHADGSSGAARAASLMPYLVPGTVELIGLALVLVGSLEGRHRR